MTNEGDEVGPGAAVAVSAVDVSDILDVVAQRPRGNAAYTLALALVLHMDGGGKTDAAGQWMPLSDGELKKCLADATGRMVDFANSGDVPWPLKRRGARPSSN